jgi:hypothetical protein
MESNHPAVGNRLLRSVGRLKTVYSQIKGKISDGETVGYSRKEK